MFIYLFIFSLYAVTFCSYTHVDTDGPPGISPSQSRRFISKTKYLTYFYTEGLITIFI